MRIGLFMRSGDGSNSEGPQKIDGCREARNAPNPPIATDATQGRCCSSLAMVGASASAARPWRAMPCVQGRSPRHLGNRGRLTGTPGSAGRSRHRDRRRRQRSDRCGWSAARERSMHRTRHNIGNLRGKGLPSDLHQRRLLARLGPRFLRERTPLGFAIARGDRARAEAALDCLRDLRRVEGREGRGMLRGLGIGCLHHVPVLVSRRVQHLLRLRHLAGGLLHLRILLLEERDDLLLPLSLIHI
eukprot:1770231-Alexandrium_andersonii.AAC.2